MRKPLGALPANPPLDGMRAESAAAEQQLQQAQAAAKAGVQETADSSSLAEVVDRILDKGIVVDAGVEASLVGTELLSVEARVVIASVETYLKHAEASGLTANGATPT